MVESIDLLIQFRSDDGVSSNNPHVFAALTRQLMPCGASLHWEM